VRTKGAAEMLIKRRLSTLQQLIQEFGLTVSVSLVSSARNKADVLTRVKKSWLDGEKRMSSICMLNVEMLTNLHNRHHQGVEKSLSLARMIDPAVQKVEVEKLVRNCVRCQSIDPARRVMREENWE
jgi:uncharacterized protein YbaP (TraB family)